MRFFGGLKRAVLGSDPQNMPHKDYWYRPGRFEILPLQKLALPRPKKGKFRKENCCFYSKFSGQNGGFCICFRFFSNRSRLSRTTSDPTRLIRPRLIDYDRLSEQPVKISPTFAHYLFEHRKHKVFLSPHRDT